MSFWRPQNDLIPTGVGDNKFDRPSEEEVMPLIYNPNVKLSIGQQRSRLPIARYCNRFVFYK